MCVCVCVCACVCVLTRTQGGNDNDPAEVRVLVYHREGETACRACVCHSGDRHTQSHIHVRAYPCLCPGRAGGNVAHTAQSHTHIHTYTHPHTHTHDRSRVTHTHTISFSPSVCLSLPLSLSLSLSLTHTHTQVATMRKKYDDLVSYTVSLTAERDRLKQVHTYMRENLCVLSSMCVCVLSTCVCVPVCVDQPDRWLSSPPVGTRPCSNR